LVVAPKITCKKRKKEGITSWETLERRITTSKQGTATRRTATARGGQRYFIKK
jgi:hypothetical protein